jgi:predicted transcriptional regulator
MNEKTLTQQVLELIQQEPRGIYEAAKLLYRPVPQVAEIIFDLYDNDVVKKQVSASGKSWVFASK